jgi:hypothetical protein
MSYLTNPYMVAPAGVTYPDSLGALNLTVYHADQLVAGGKFDNCLDFNGSSYLVNADNIYAAMSSTGTVSMWIYPDGLVNGQNFWGYGTEGAETFLRVFMDGTGGNVAAGIKVGGTWAWLAYCQAGDISAGSWQSLIVTHSGVVPEIYINGVASINSYGVTTDKTVWISGLTGGALGRFGVARYDSSNNGYFDGALDDIGIYSADIGASLASDIYDGGTGKKISEVSTANCKFYSKCDSLSVLNLANDALPV